MLLLNFKPQPPAANVEAPLQDDTGEDDTSAHDKK
jgi:hypothetical protein